MRSMAVCAAISPTAMTASFLAAAMLSGLPARQAHVPRATRIEHFALIAATAAFAPPPRLVAAARRVTHRALETSTVALDASRHGAKRERGGHCHGERARGIA